MQVDGLLKKVYNKFSTHSRIILYSKMTENEMNGLYNNPTNREVKESRQWDSYDWWLDHPSQRHCTGILYVRTIQYCDICDLQRTWWQKKKYIRKTTTKSVKTYQGLLAVIDNFHKLYSSGYGIHIHRTLFIKSVQTNILQRQFLIYHCRMKWSTKSVQCDLTTFPYLNYAQFILLLLVL